MQLHLHLANLISMCQSAGFQCVEHSLLAAGNIASCQHQRLLLTRTITQLHWLSLHATHHLTEHTKINLKVLFVALVN